MRTLFYSGSLLIAILIIGSASCKKEDPSLDFRTENVIVVVIDGVRLSESWADPSHQYIPYQYNELMTDAVLNREFKNIGVTNTVPGHTAISTGHYQEINNDGLEIPSRPSFFQFWKEQSDQDDLHYIVASKGKLEVLADCEDLDWQGLYQPSTNCGNDGGGVTSSSRNDSLTLEVIKDILDQEIPKSMLINLSSPDYAGHYVGWEEYLEAISNTDEYVFDLWNFIQAHPHYSNRTALIITNDHGRHLDDQGGFMHHGDGCAGCRDISLLALGPDFNKNLTVNTPRDQRDISATIAYMMGFNFPSGEGNVMLEIFK